MPIMKHTTFRAAGIMGVVQAISALGVGAEPAIMPCTSSESSAVRQESAMHQATISGWVSPADFVGIGSVDEGNSLDVETMAGLCGHPGSDFGCSNASGFNGEGGDGQTSDFDSDSGPTDPAQQYGWAGIFADSTTRGLLGWAYQPAPPPMARAAEAVAVPRFEITRVNCGVGNSGRMPVAPADSAWPFGYSSERFFEQGLSAKYETAGLLALVSVIGVANWDWGSSSFRFNSEGWFSEERTGSGGMDKLGHAFSTYLMTDFLTHAIRRNSSDPRGGEITAALLSCSVMTYVEVFDGFSGDHGFSYEDMVMNALGAGFSVFRNTVPRVREKIDFRMQYLPSEYSSFEPFGDYSGQKFFLCVKLAGFEMFRESPLRYVELHGGYSARGFSHEERSAGDRLERNLYVGIGLNLQELLFGQGPHRDHWASKAARTGLEYVQVPYSYLSSDGNSGR